MYGGFSPQQSDFAIQWAGVPLRCERQTFSVLVKSTSLMSPMLSTADCTAVYSTDSGVFSQYTFSVCASLHARHVTTTTRKHQQSYWHADAWTPFTIHTVCTLITPWPLTFDLGVMYSGTAVGQYRPIYTDFGVDSSSSFSFRARTDRHTDKYTKSQIWQIDQPIPTATGVQNNVDILYICGPTLSWQASCDIWGRSL